METGGPRGSAACADGDVGLLELQTGAHEGTPGENFGVFRLRRRVFNPSSVAGVMVTSFAGDGRRNVAVAADTSLRLYRDDYVGLKWAATDDTGAGTAAERGLAARSLFDARWERRTERGLSYTWQFTRAGAEYRPELGFVPRRDGTDRR